MEGVCQEGWLAGCDCTARHSKGDPSLRLKNGSAQDDAVWRLLSADVDHGSGCVDEVGFADVMAFFFLLDYPPDEVGDFFVAGAAAHLGMEIVVPHRKKAGSDFAVASDADAATVAAERMRHGSDNADFPDAIVEAVAARGFRTCVGGFDERAVLGHARQDFIERDYGRGRPGSSFFERHELDEAHGHVLFAGEHAEGDNLIFVESAHQDAVHFDGSEPGAASCP